MTVVLSTAGSHQAEFLIAHGRAAQAVELPALVPRSGRLPSQAPGNEGAALDAADLVLAGSDLVRDTIRKFYDLDRSYKVHDQPVWSAEWVTEAVEASGVQPQPFSERSVDVLFCATDWRRAEKNLAAVRRIVTGLGGLKVTIVGECPAPVAGARHLGRITDRAEMFRLMADSKVVASTSLVDACPTTLFEAAALGCNVVASKNCGNWRLCHPDLLVDPSGDAATTAAIRRGVAAPRESGLDWFLDTRSYARMMDILQALAA
jgi:glycosyltransferase involved in cell wall biosynthesis